MCNVNIPAPMTELGDIKQPKSCDDHFPTLQKDVLTLQVFMDNVLSTEVTHSLKQKNMQDENDDDDEDDYDYDNYK